MLLLHGAGSSRRVWMLVMEFLAAERDVIAVDLPGHGDSQLMEEGMPPTPQNFARLMVTFLRELGVETTRSPCSPACARSTMRRAPRRRRWWRG